MHYIVLVIIYFKHISIEPRRARRRAQELGPSASNNNLIMIFYYSMCCIKR